MLDVFSLIFVADTKISFRYDFVALLTKANRELLCKIVDLKGISTDI